jgi:hypothetical protein
MTAIDAAYEATFQDPKCTAVKLALTGCLMYEGLTRTSASDEAHVPHEAAGPF